ncbi:hypothetical protein ACQJBY_000084 [Aegilops geniculata]
MEVIPLRSSSVFFGHGQVRRNRRCFLIACSVLLFVSLRPTSVRSSGAIPLAFWGQFQYASLWMDCARYLFVFMLAGQRLSSVLLFIMLGASCFSLVLSTIAQSCSTHLRPPPSRT